MVAVAATTAAISVQSDDLNMTYNADTAFVSQVNFTLASQATVLISAFAENLDTNDVQITLTLDGGTILYQGGAGTRVAFTRTLAAGAHTIDYSGFSFASDAVAKYRGVTVLDYTSGIGV